jgi:hypothetical protein
LPCRKRKEKKRKKKMLLQGLDGLVEKKKSERGKEKR